VRLAHPPRPNYKADNEFFHASFREWLSSYRTICPDHDDPSRVIGVHQNQASQRNHQLTVTANEAKGKTARIP
jgi:hypothetical protein